MKPKDVAIQERPSQIVPLLNEKQRRQFAAVEAKAYGHGEISAISRGSGVSRNAIYRGINEMENGDLAGPKNIRKPGGGRKKKKYLYPDTDFSNKTPKCAKAK